MPQRQRILLLWLVCLTALFAATGCSHQSVRHLDRQPWLLGAQRELPMKFWTFQYSTIPMNGAYGVRGEAIPRLEAIPSGMRRVEELWLAAYLSDRRGRVLAQSVQIFLPRDIGDRGAPFEFILKPETLESGPLFVTFGYRMVLGPGGNGATAQDAFFASEGAVTRY